MRCILLFITFLCCISLPTFSQKQICGFDYLQQQLRKDPKYKQQEQKTNTKLRAKADEIIRYRSLMNNMNILPGYIYEVPVVVHVIYKAGDATPGSATNPSDAKIQEAINRLNSDFSATGTGNIGAATPMRFTLAKRTPNCEATNGINRIDGSKVSGYTANGLSMPYSGAPGANDSTIKALSGWSPRSYLNIWVVWKITADTQGYYIAAYTAMPLTVDGDLHVFPDDGIVVIGSEVRGNSSSLTHEAGHAMGLYHTFEGDIYTANTCPENTNCNLQGDNVCDTDPVKNLIFANPFPLDSDPNVCNNNLPFNGSQSNIMGYGIGPLNRFTSGQSSRMLACFEAVRNGYASSQASLLPPAEKVKTALQKPGENKFGTGYFVGPCSVFLGDLRYNSYGNYYDGDLSYIDNSCNIGTNLSPLQPYLLLVTTQYSSQRCKAWIDFNNDGSFDSTEIVMNSLNPDDVDFVHQATISSDKMASAFIARNKLLRMRIMADWSDSPDFNTGSTLEYGQTEDFWISINSALAAVFANINAVYKANQLQISWNTSSEHGNDHFLIEGSKDGSNFFIITTQKSKAIDGNSSSTLSYLINLSNANGSLASSLSIILVIIIAFVGFTYKRKLIFIASFGLLILLACNKQADRAAMNNDDEVKFIRITQVDKNGSKSASKAVKIIKE